MSQYFRRHPVLVNYEASSDGVVRHRRLKKPVGWVSNMGYLMFRVGKKNLCHIIIYECHKGLIKDGFVIDHINGVKTDNCLENLQAISQSQNIKRVRTGTCKSFGKRPVIAFDLETNEQKVFQSMKEACRYFNICMPSVRFVAENITKSAISKVAGHKIHFSYIRGDNSLMDKSAYTPQNNIDP